MIAPIEMIQAEWHKGFYVPEVFMVDKNTIILKDEKAVHSRVRPTGHWMYVRKCMRPEIDGGVALPDSFQENTNWCWVLAIGPNVGKQRTGKYLNDNEHETYKWLNNPVAVGDTVSAPDTHPWGIKRSPYCYFDYFVDEQVMSCFIESEEHVG